MIKAAKENKPQNNNNWMLYLQRLSSIQMFLGIVMQSSYVAFPSYNFALSLWLAISCIQQTESKVWGILLSLTPFSILIDIIWMSLWTTGEIFQDTVCNLDRIHILSCSGTNMYPGCRTNQLAFAMLVLNILAKTASTYVLYKVAASQTSMDTKGAEVHPFPEQEYTEQHDAASNYTIDASAPDSYDYSNDDAYYSNKVC